MTKKTFLFGAAVGGACVIAVLLALQAGLLGTQPVSAADAPLKAIAVITGTEGNDVTGMVMFKEVDGGVEIEAHINGLTPGKHGFHIH